jgi:hypothetical protein
MEAASSYLVVSRSGKKYNYPITGSPFGLQEVEVPTVSIN